MLWTRLASASALCLAALALCACETLSPLPSGAPPPGEIVAQIKDKPELPSPDQAVNRMSMALTMKIVSLPADNRPPFIALIEGDDDAGLGMELEKSLERSKIAKLLPAGSLKKADFNIDSRLDRNANRWAVRLVAKDGQRLLWADSVEIDTANLQAAK